MLLSVGWFSVYVVFVVVFVICRMVWCLRVDQAAMGSWATTLFEMSCGHGWWLNSGGQRSPRSPAAGKAGLKYILVQKF